MDEARYGQKGSVTRLWAPTGSRPVMVRQTEYQWAYAYGAVNPASGQSVAIIAPTVNTEWMSEYLRILAEHLGPSRRAVLVLDQAGWHVSKKLAVPANIDLLFLPPYSPEVAAATGWIERTDEPRLVSVMKKPGEEAPPHPLRR
jgi:hypothetical protein